MTMPKINKYGNFAQEVNNFFRFGEAISNPNVIRATGISLALHAFTEHLKK